MAAAILVANDQGSLGATVLLWAAALVHGGTWKEFLNAIATGLLVSAAFGIAQALITSRVAGELLRASCMILCLANICQ